MLDLGDSMTPHIFRASALIDSIMLMGQEMTVAPSTVRAELLAKCLPRFAAMHELNREHFGHSPYIARAIGQCEAGIRKLASLGDGLIVEDRRDGVGNCPYCGTPIRKFNPLAGLKGRDDRFVILCTNCDDLYMPAISKLRSFKGFFTDAI